MSEAQSSTATIEQIPPGDAPGEAVNADAPIGFFAIGIVINLALLAAYGIWAWRRWKQPNPSE